MFTNLEFFLKVSKELPSRVFGVGCSPSDMLEVMHFSRIIFLVSLQLGSNRSDQGAFLGNLVISYRQSQLLRWTAYRTSFNQNFFHKIPWYHDIFAEIPILKALELSKIEVGRDFWAYTALEKTLDRTNLKTVCENSMTFFLSAIPWASVTDLTRIVLAKSNNSPTILNVLANSSACRWLRRPLPCTAGSSKIGSRSS